MSQRYAVETIDRYSNGGITYTITDRAHRVIARVEETNKFYNVRDAYDEPCSVGGLLYTLAITAVKDYKAWTAKH